MPDIYASFAELCAREIEGIDFRIVDREGSTRFAIVAPHGGGIEPGTAEIADAVAAADHSLYSFQGLKRENAGDLHITSARFDEPRCISLISRVQTVVTIHGRKGGREITFIGGLDAGLKETMFACLTQAGFACSYEDEPQFRGLSPGNICNRGISGAGVQLEISRGVRDLLFERLGAEPFARATARFAPFVAAVRKALI